MITDNQMSVAAREAAQLSDLVPICSHLPSASVDQLIGATRVISHGGGRLSHAQLLAALHLDDEQTVAWGRYAGTMPIPRR
jgi:hypothetical protein